MWQTIIFRSVEFIYLSLVCVHQSFYICRPLWPHGLQQTSPHHGFSQNTGRLPFFLQDLPHAGSNSHLLPLSLAGRSYLHHLGSPSPDIFMSNSWEKRRRQPQTLIIPSRCDLQIQEEHLIKSFGYFTCKYRIVIHSFQKYLLSSDYILETK